MPRCLWQEDSERIVLFIIRGGVLFEILGKTLFCEDESLLTGL